MKSRPERLDDSNYTMDKRLSNTVDGLLRNVYKANRKADNYILKVLMNFTKLIFFIYVPLGIFNIYSIIKLNDALSFIIALKILLELVLIFSNFVLVYSVIKKKNLKFLIISFLCFVILLFLKLAVYYM